MMEDKPQLARNTSKDSGSSSTSKPTAGAPGPAQNTAQLMQEKIVADILQMEDKARGRISWEILRAYLSMVGWGTLAAVSISKRG
jgi:hypothetical protein